MASILNVTKISLSRLGQEIISFGQEMSTVGHSFRMSFDADVVDLVDSIRELEDVSQIEFDGIRISLDEVAMAYSRVYWWNPAWQVLKARKRVLAFVILLSLAAISLVISVLPNSPPNSNSVAGVGLFLAMSILVIRGFVHSRLHHRVLAVLRVLETVLALIFLTTINRWAYDIQRLWMTGVHDLAPSGFAARNHLENASAVGAVQTALWFFAFIGILNLLVRFVSFAAKDMITPTGSSYGHAEELSSSVILALFRVALAAESLSVLLSKKRRSDTTDKNLFDLQYRLQRHKIRYNLNNAARLIRGPWAEAMCAENGIAGRWTATYASQIEFFIRYQQSVNMFVGENLVNLRDCMITAAVHAVEGNWHLIGSDQAELIAVLKARRWKLALRRIVAIILPCGVAFVFAKFIPYIASPYRSLVIVTCVAYACVQLFSLIDPDFSARIDIATKLAGMVKR